VTDFCFRPVPRPVVLPLLALLPLAAGLAGCSCCTETFPDACRVDVRADPAARAVADEIDAAAALTFDSSKTEALLRIARRPGLPALAQVHLVNAVFANLTFESSREEVLLALIRNPSFRYVARRCLLARLKNLTFESTKESLLRALDENPPAETPGQAERDPAAGA